MTQIASLLGLRGLNAGNGGGMLALGERELVAGLLG
jgi:hypothetical protein